MTDKCPRDDARSAGRGLERELADICCHGVVQRRMSGFKMVSREQGSGPNVQASGLMRIGATTQDYDDDTHTQTPFTE